MTIRRYRLWLTGSALAVTLLSASAVRHGTVPALAVTLVLAAIAFIAGYAAYGFTAPLFKRFNEATRQIGQGDLTGGLDRFPAPGEFGQLAENVRKVCKGMIKHLGEIVRNMGVLERNAEHIKGGIEQVVLGGRAQAAGIKEIVNLVETYEDRNQNSTDLSASAQALAVDTGALAVQGAEKISKVREMIEKIQVQVQAVENAAGQIGETVELIAEMSGQTNFLAFSAAIEAARAGERGRGFAMVAGQVNRLAEGAGQSTTEIAAIIEGVYQGVADTKRAVREGLESLQHFETSFTDIRNKAQGSLSMAREIGGRLKEQGATAAQVIENVRSIAVVAGETAATAESIGSLTGELGKVVERFRVVADTYRI
ncbi:MAG TPA: methyl-accepting chemotaxis protein [Spirochaetia bacterium]|nr:methyl-accepting chemotaxis protein [Spirochaetia bacterium]